jgi:predicted Zn-dependent protease
MSAGDAKAFRSSAWSGGGERIEDRQRGPADTLDLAPFDALHPHVRRLLSILEGFPSERTEVRVETCAQRLAGGRRQARFAATVRLAVRGPGTLSPILWQAGGVDVDIDAWAADLSDVLPRERRAIEAGEPLVDPWTGTVVLDPWVASLLVHECIGHTSEADNYLEYAQPNGLSLGHRWTDAALTVVDDPTQPGRIGSYEVDDEGEPARATTVVAGGVWKELLHDRLTAAKLSVARSGNGRRVAGAATSLPRMSVLAALPGDHTIERLLGEVDDGWYCSGSWGAGSIGRRFMLRPTHARRIRDGRLQDGYLRRFDLRGDKFATIAAIDAVGDDARRFDPAFGCDKNGQDDLPVSFGAPHLRLRGITLVPIRASRS